MRVSLNFGQMGDLQDSVMRTHGGVGLENESWVRQVDALVAVWPDAAGMDLSALSRIATDFNTVNNDFLAMLGGALGKTNEAHQQALAWAMREVNG